MICPFCMNVHDPTVRECPEKQLRIPVTYLEAGSEKIPVLFIMTIGYTEHGKTCFLSSLLHSLHEGSFAKSWPRFSFLGLTQETLKSISQSYITPLHQGILPASTQVFFPAPLILEFQYIPLRIGVFKRVLSAVSSNGGQVDPSDVIVVFYDIGGEIFDVKNQIDTCLPILQKINPLIFLMDLPGMLEKAQEGELDVRERMHALINNIHLALTEGAKRKKRDIVVCFTKADKMWGKPEMYGPLSERLDNSIPTAEEIAGYMANLESFSKNVGDYIASEYSAFYNTTVNNFGNLRFAAVSALGSSPENNKIRVLEPNRVFDPLFWSFRLNKLL